MTKPSERTNEQTIRGAAGLLGSIALSMMGIALWTIHGSTEPVRVIVFGPEIYFMLVAGAIMARRAQAKRSGDRALTLLLCLAIGGALAGPALGALGRLSPSTGALLTSASGATLFMASKLRRAFSALEGGALQASKRRPIFLLGAIVIVVAYGGAALYGFGGLLSRLGG